MSIAATFKPPGLSTPRPEGNPRTRVYPRNPMLAEVLSTAAPILIASTAAGAAGVGALAVGYRDWSAGEWLAVIAALGTASLPFIAAVATGVVQIVRAVRGEAEKTRGMVQANTDITTQAAAVQVNAVKEAKAVAVDAKGAIVEAKEVAAVAKQVADSKGEELATHFEDLVRKSIDEALAGVPKLVEKAAKEAFEHKLRNIEQRQIYATAAEKIADTNVTVHRLEEKIAPPSPPAHPSPDAQL